MSVQSMAVGSAGWPPVSARVGDGQEHVWATVHIPTELRRVDLTRRVEKAADRAQGCRTGQKIRNGRPTGESFRQNSGALR